MLNSKPLNKLIFIDLETAPQYKSFFDMSTALQELFLKRFKKESEELLSMPMDFWDMEQIQNGVEVHPKIEQLYANRAPVTPEFLKVICVSIGWIDEAPDTTGHYSVIQKLTFKHKSFYGHDEVKILKNFYDATKSVLDKTLNHSHHLVGYNGLMFDFPVLAKRFIINKLPLPAMLDMDGKKEWNLQYLVDPRTSWKMTSFDGGVSLALLCEVLGVPTPKSDISGADVRDVYYNNGDVDRIAKYCVQDIYRLCECYLRMKSMPNELILSE